MPYIDGKWYEDADQAPLDPEVSFPNSPSFGNDPTQVLFPNSPSWGLDPMAGVEPAAAPAAAPEEAQPAYRGYYDQGGSRAPDMSWWRDAPEFSFNYDPWRMPDADSLSADPGYDFRRTQGAKALEQSAAGQGRLRTGGTLKDILGYGQSLASQEYANHYNRSKDVFGTNFDNRYRIARDSFSPKLLSWQQEMGARQNASNLSFGREWDAFTYGTPSATTIFNAGAA